MAFRSHKPFSNLDLKKTVKPSSKLWHLMTKDFFHRFEEIRNVIDRKFIYFRYNMIRMREMQLPITEKTVAYSYSNVCGHGAFVLLAVSYLETDFLRLRMYAASGISLSIMFQYYRTVPLKIPIKWNSLFLFINSYMLAILLKEANDAEQIPEDQKSLYLATFARYNMSAVEFYKIMNIARMQSLKKGDQLVKEGEVDPDFTPDLSQLNPDFTPDLSQLNPDFTPDLSQLNPDFTPNLSQLNPDFTPDLTRTSPRTCRSTIVSTSSRAAMWRW